MSELADLVAGLRGAWVAAAYAVSDDPDLAELLGRRLDELCDFKMLDQESLAGVIDEAADRLHRGGDEAKATALTRRLLRCTYEFLLAVDARRQVAAGRPDAIAAPEPALAPADSLPATPGSPGATSDEQLVDQLLQRGHLEEAAAALRRLTDTGAGGPGLVPLAIEVGDRCREAAMTRAAGDSYLAAWSADRLDPQALWRLADLAVATEEFDLAVSWLDHVAGVLRSRGDRRGVARVYRKMCILAPDRDDLRELLRRAQLEIGVH